MLGRRAGRRTRGGACFSAGSWTGFGARLWPRFSAGGWTGFGAGFRTGFGAGRGMGLGAFGALGRTGGNTGRRLMGRPAQTRARFIGAV
jgi:hypothetical protein